MENQVEVWAEEPGVKVTAERRDNVTALTITTPAGAITATVGNWRAARIAALFAPPTEHAQAVDRLMREPDQAQAGDGKGQNPHEPMTFGVDLGKDGDVGIVRCLGCGHECSTHDEMLKHLRDVHQRPFTYDLNDDPRR